MKTRQTVVIAPRMNPRVKVPDPSIMCKHDRGYGRHCPYVAVRGTTRCEKHQHEVIA